MKLFLSSCLGESYLLFEIYYKDINMVNYTKLIIFLFHDIKNVYTDGRKLSALIGNIVHV